MKPFCGLFPAFSGALREPDPEFQREAQVLEELNIPWRVFNVEALIQGEMETALLHFGTTEQQYILYRGPILHPEEYATLAEAVTVRGGRFFTSPPEYRRGLLFPEFFSAIADYSFPAVWTEGKDPKQALKAAKRLGPPPYFVKDYTKSAKEIWPEGCVVTNEEAMTTVIQALVDYRGNRFEGGVVIRPLLRLRYVDENPFGGKIFEEYRLFFFEGKLVCKAAYDRSGGDVSQIPDYEFLPQQVGSRFFTADVVVTEEGKILLLEVGDGGSSALPPTVSPSAFYRTISELMLYSRV